MTIESDNCFSQFLTFATWIARFLLIETASCRVVAFMLMWIHQLLDSYFLIFDLVVLFLKLSIFFIQFILYFRNFMCQFFNLFQCICVFLNPWLMWLLDWHDFILELWLFLSQSLNALLALFQRTLKFVNSWN